VSQCPLSRGGRAPGEVPRGHQAARWERAAPRRAGRLAAGWMAAGLAGVLLAACATGTAASPQGPHPPAAATNPMLDTGTSLGGQPAPDIHLVNQFGQRMSLSQFRGKAVVLAFVDSECTNVCPLTTTSMVEAKQLLGPAGRSVQLLGVVANPKATAVSDAMAYSRAHGMVNQWDFLTGSLAQLRAVWRAYHIAVQIERGQIDHTPALFVIDQRGRERTVYLTQMSFASISQSAQVMARELASLLPGHPAPRSQSSLGYIPGLSPRTGVTLPGLPAGRVPLGPGRARLVLFFATWVAETSDLRAHLLALNRYASAARHGRLPVLAAVDEGATEPSAGAAAAYLKGLGTRLRYPVGVDTTGRLADGYGVQDQPWFVFLSPSGKIVWKHDGWVGVHALTAAARGAG
jgi:cytochrome oxidase Cu insertion factor (SCO1/SenC/PrrC family)